MTEMVERVAKAIASPACWEAASESIRETWRMEARAAIEAMRESTDEMKIASLVAASEFNEAAVERHKAAGGDAWIVSTVVAGDGRLYEVAWRAAIDEALK